MAQSSVAQPPISELPQQAELAGPDDFCGRLLVASLPTRGGFSGGNGFAPQLRQGRDHGELYILSALYIYLFCLATSASTRSGLPVPFTI